MIYNIIANGWIEPNCRSTIFHLNISRLLTILETTTTTSTTTNNYNIKISSINGLLSPLIITDLNNNNNKTNDDNDDWLNHVKLATNCFEQNMIAFPASSLSTSSSLTSSASSQQHLVTNMNETYKPNEQIPVFFIVIKPIEPGEQLSFWPWIGLSIQLNIPIFLLPNNIINNHCYICHRCGHSYSQPNPLKIHLMFKCSNIVNDKSLTTLTSPPSSSLHYQQSTMKKVMMMDRKNSRLNSNHNNNNNNNKQPTESTITSVSTTTNSIINHETITNHHDTSNNNNGNNNGNISRRLHTCSYCGKVYTRKYGLKIHIRTHTGIKPLSCRYCGRSFSDPSNLNKHMRLHTQQQQQLGKNRDHLTKMIRYHQHHQHHQKI